MINARALNYDLVQTVVGGMTDYSPMELSAVDAVEYKKMSYGIDTYVHLPYVINPCEEKPQRRGFYKKAMKQFCQTAAMIGAKAVVLHPGFKKELTDEQALQNLIKFMDETFNEDWNLDVLLETDAGSKNGSAIGSVAFIGKVIEDLGNPRVGMCIDTCHLYARGVDIWKEEELNYLLDDYGRDIKLVHLNSPDPGVDLGSFRDRHNTAFSDRPDLKPEGTIRVLTERFPCVLERSSLAVQEKDASYVRSLKENS